MKKCLLPFAAIAWLVAFEPALHAQPIPLPPVIPIDMVLSASEYVVMEETKVEPQATLTIPPGAIIRFHQPTSKLNVFGALFAAGTPDQHIFFTSEKSGDDARPGDWGEVLLNSNPSLPGSVLQNCEFSFGGGQIPLDNAAARVMLRIQSAPVLIEDCTFIRAFGSGVGYSGPPTQTFTRCGFFGNVYGGVSAENSVQANINLVDCVVAGNYIALMGIWRPQDFDGFSGNVFANTYNAVVLAAGGTVASGDTVTVSTPPPSVGLLGIIEGSFRVEQNGTLEFAPFAQIYFTAGSRILVSGALRTSAAGLTTKGAYGNAGAPSETPFSGGNAFFSSIPAFKLPRTLAELSEGQEPAPPPGDSDVINPADSWGGIFFLRDADDAGSVVQNLQIDRAAVALTFDRASIRIDGCTVSNSITAGMRCTTAAHPEISRSLITNSQSDGLVCEGDSAPAITKTTITGSRRAGLVVRDTANPLLLENIISGNRDGVEIGGTAAPTLGNVNNALPLDDGRNIITGNTRYALVNYTRNRILAQNVFWGVQNAGDIDNVIYDDDEDPTLGEVLYLPTLGQNPTPVASQSPTPTPTPGTFQLSPTPTPTQAVETFLSGDINSDLLLGGVVHVTSNVTVLGFASLRFAPGTIVRVESTFDAVSSPESAIYVRARNGGRISVEGRRDEPVIFTTVDDGYWGGLSIEGPETLPSVVRYAHVQRALTGLRLQNTGAQIEQCRFQYCKLGVLTQKSTGAVDPRLRANLFMENELGWRTVGAANPDLGSGEADPGSNVFYLNTTDADVQGPLAPVAAIGNYWSEAGPDGEVVRIDDAAAVRQRRIIGDNSPAGIVIEPLGITRGGYLAAGDFVWMGRVLLDDSSTLQVVATVDGEVITEQAVQVNLDARLRILPGTTILVQPRRNIVIMVAGRLDAIGTAARPIVFRSGGSPRQPTDWRGVRFLDGADLAEPSLMRYCELSDAYTCVSVVHRSPTLEHLRLRNFSDQGILVSSLGQYERKADGAAEVGNPFGISRPRISDCDVQGGEYAMVSVDAAPVLTRSILTSAVISSVFVSGNNVPDLGNVEDADPSNDGGNVIGGSIRYDVENISSTIVHAQNNFWGLVAVDSAVDAKIYDDDERFFSGEVRFLPRQDAVPPYFLVAGDLNGNGQLDASDLAALSSAWHCVVGDPEYRADLDVDGDYQVDKKDLLFISNRLTE